ncbi:TIGR01777 family oxidoreductase [Fodinicola acaciae]|uniref:TIGR01777 family oxidoreductase n=1 Tax=Fodinicola acaciae TaxID=2681555 RepID=UPI0013D3A772|nr:TIGR01777 family oxidoreductase [Fodinicola acaciae]
MRVAVTGASGLIGSALVPVLVADGHEVVTLVRREPAAGEVRWDPARRELDPEVFAEIDAVVHLAGAGVGDRRWSATYKKTLLDSRIDGTTAVAGALAAVAADGRERVLLSASAVGWYGDASDHEVDESSPRGGGFLADLVREWEASTGPAEDAGVRVAHLRSGLVCDRSGGLMRKLLPIFRLGAGGPMGSGRQCWPWITLPDELAAIRFLMTHREVSGAVNLVAPQPATNAEFATALGNALHRPAIVPAPAFALRLALGEFADEGVLIGQRVVPKVLLDAGFTFQHPRLDEAMRWIASRLV